MGAAATEGQPTETATCGAKTRAGTPCRHAAGKGTDHVGYGSCRVHSGNTPAGRVHAARLHVASLAIVHSREPHEALRHAQGRAEEWEQTCSAMVAALDPDEMMIEVRKTRVGPDGTTVEWSNEVRLNAWVSERKRAVHDLARIAKSAIDVGVDERRVRVTEQLGGSLEALIQVVLDAAEVKGERRAKALDAGELYLVALEAGPAVAGLAA